MWSFRLWKEYIDAGELSDVWAGDQVVGPFSMSIRWYMYHTHIEFSQLK